MKKNFFLLLLLITMCGCAMGQTVTITGTVKDTNGDFLHYAFVQDKHNKSGAYTDSLGNFTLETQANAALVINCAGYKDTALNVSGTDALMIVLHPAVAAANGAVKGGTDVQQGGNTAILRTTLQDQIDLSPNTLPITTQGSIMPSIHIKEATQGSRTLFKDWVHGYIVNSGDTLVQSPGFFLNYDKIGGSLLLTRDKVSTIAVYRDKVHSFTLFDNLNQASTFTMVPEIDKKHYVQVLAAGKNYQIYKLTTTKFIASNYSSDGIGSQGNNYDEYADEYTYYVARKGGAPQKISLRKKSLKEAFNADLPKLNQYMQTNDGDIDDNYLKALGDFMNK